MTGSARTRRLFASPTLFNLLCWGMPLAVFASVLLGPIRAQKLYNEALDEYDALRKSMLTVLPESASDAVIASLRGQTIDVWLKVTHAYWYYSCTMAIWMSTTVVTLVICESSPRHITRSAVGTDICPTFRYSAGCICALEDETKAFRPAKDRSISSEWCRGRAGTLEQGALLRFLLFRERSRSAQSEHWFGPTLAIALIPITLLDRAHETHLADCYFAQAFYIYAFRQASTANLQVAIQAYCRASASESLH